MVDFNYSILTGYFNARITQNLLPTLGSQSNFQQSASATPAPSEDLPWRREIENATLLRKALATSSFLPKSVRDDALSADEDYQPILTAWEALQSISSLAKAVQDGSLNEGQLALAEKKFQSGLAEVKDFVGDMNLSKVTLLTGEKLPSIESEYALQRARSEYTTNVVHSGDFDAEVAGFTGDRVFTMSIVKSGVTTDLNIDLSEMGGTLRNLDNVLEFINGKLDDGGFITNLERVKIGTEDEDGVISSDDFGFKITAPITEKVSFSANDSAPAAWLVGSSGKARDSGALVSKWSDIETTASREFASRIGVDGSDAEFVAVETHPDGGIVAVGTTTGGFDAQGIRGESDVFLARYDSEGKEIWRRQLGANDSAQATGLAVSSDGQIAISGIVEGDLTTSAIGGDKDGFVTLYDESGIEQWTRQRGSSDDDSINSVSFTSNGSILIAGRTTGSITDDAVSGESDSFIERLDATGEREWIRQFGTDGADSVSAVTEAPDGTILTVGKENGEAVVRSYLNGVDDPSDWTHSLGDLQGGSLNDIATDASGNIYVAGETRSDGETAGQFSGSAQLHSDGFVAQIDISGASPTTGWITRLGGDDYQNAENIQVSGDKVYVAGTGEGSFGTASSDATQSAFLTSLNTSDGTQGATESLTGRNKTATGQAIAIDNSHSETLGAFGLPNGRLIVSDSAAITDRFPIRAGDHFYLSVDGGSKKKITIEQDDNLRSLSFKINSALVFEGQADVRRGTDGQRLRITPGDDSRIDLSHGSEGRDALTALGLTPGVLIKTPIPGDEDSDSDAPEIVAMNLTPELSLLDEDNIDDVVSAVDSALRALSTAYRWQTDDPTLLQLRNGDDGPGKNRDGLPPAYLTSQINNLQAGLNRLLSGSGQTSFLA